jgi:hypothetical protein
MIYIVTETATGNEIYRYQADSVIEWNGMEFATHTHTAFVEPVEGDVITRKFGGRRLLTKLEFRNLFPVAALKSIDRFQTQFEQSAFLTDAQKDDIRTSFKNYAEALDVDLDDPRWVPGLGLYVGLGYLTEQEVAEVLRG